MLSCFDDAKIVSLTFSAIKGDGFSMQKGKKMMQIKYVCSDTMCFITLFLIVLCFAFDCFRDL